MQQVIREYDLLIRS